MKLKSGLFVPRGVGTKNPPGIVTVGLTMSSHGDIPEHITIAAIQSNGTPGTSIKTTTTATTPAPATTSRTTHTTPAPATTSRTTTITGAATSTTTHLPNTTDVIVTSFNCKGFSQSADYICKLLQDCDILCLTETWLWPNELDIIQCAINATFHGSDSFVVFAKSSMCDIEGDYHGRPFGGLAIICKRRPDFIYYQEVLNCDRVLALKLCDNTGTHLQTIVNVYMPYYDSQMTEEFTCTIDFLQDYIDNHTSDAPIKFFGDFNVQLPTKHNLSSNWHRCKGFNTHSKIMFDFITGNNLVCADMCFNQKVKYSYFCHKRNIYTWIDHVLMPEYELNTVRECKIIELTVNNVSDHLPLRTVFSIHPVPANDYIRSGVKSNTTTKPYWNNNARNALYTSVLENKLHALPTFTFGEDRDRASVERDVNSAINFICTAIHDAANNSGVLPKRSFTPKPYWCPELNALRDRKRFWWSLWVANDRKSGGYF